MIGSDLPSSCNSTDFGPLAHFIIVVVIVREEKVQGNDLVHRFHHCRDVAGSWWREHTRRNLLFRFFHKNTVFFFEEETEKATSPELYRYDVPVTKSTVNCIRCRRRRWEILMSGNAETAVREPEILKSMHRYYVPGSYFVSLY